MKIEVKNVWKPVTLTYRIDNKETLETIIKAMGRSDYPKADERVFMALSNILGVQKQYPLDLEFTFDSFEELRDLEHTMGNTGGSDVGFEFYMKLNEYVCKYWEDFE
jgi:hypothetical protein